MSFSDPVNNIEQLGVNEGVVVADLGAGTGAYSLAVASKVGDDGMVYSVDVQKELLEQIKLSATSQNISNLEIIWGDIEKISGTKLKDLSVDIVIVANILFQVEDKDTVISEIKRILKQKGRVLIVDWVGSFNGLGPQLADVVSEEQAKSLFEKEGFSYERSIMAGDHHYGIILRKI
ncbi:class I SAM-dependent methyltransferase [Patescibacteria group bacterium]